MDAMLDKHQVELSSGVSGEILDVFLEVHAELERLSHEMGDIADHVLDVLEELSEQDVPVFSLQDDDAPYPHIEEDESMAVLVSSALSRRVSEGRAVKEPTFALVSPEGHVFVISLNHPETSSVIRTALA